MGAIQTLDERILWWIAEHLRVSWLNGPVVRFSTLGNAGLLFIAVTLVLLVFKRTRRMGVHTAAGLIVDVLAVNVTIKPLVSRARPWLVMEGFQTLTRSSDPNSFPSGHTCAAFAFAAAIWVATPNKKIRAAALIVAVLMGLSRLYVGVHFPSDVLAGMVIGSLCGLLGGFLARRVLTWRDSRKAAG